MNSHQPAAACASRPLVRMAAAGALAALLLSGCMPRFDALEPRAPHSAPKVLMPDLSREETDELRGQIVVQALFQSGKQYRYGGNGPEDFDCSGLVRYVYAQVGLTVPRTTRTLFASGAEVEFSRVRPGDLLFYRFEGDLGPPSHVMIYLGGGEAIHAPAGGKVVQTAKVSSKAFTKRFMGARRLLN